MNKKEFQETEEAFRAYFRKGRTEEPEEYPEFQPDFEDIKRRLEEVDSGKRVLPPLSPTPEEWNRQVRVERMQRARKVASVAAAVVVVIGVAGGAYWLGRESAVVPNPSDSEAESVAVESDSTSENSTTVESTTDTSEGETSVTRLPGGEVTYEEAVQLTGLPLVKADDMDGFEGYQLSMSSGQIYSVNYRFTDAFVDIYVVKDKAPFFSYAKTVNYANRVFEVQEDTMLENGNQISVRYVSTSGEILVGNFNNVTADEAVQLLNTLVF